MHKTSALSSRIRGEIALAAALLLALTGCSSADATFTANPHLTRYSWGVAFSSTNPKVSFPLPEGWKPVSLKTPGGEPDTVRLQSASGACQLLFSRASAGESPVEAIDRLRQAFAKDSRPVQARGTQQVGNLQAQWLDVDFGKGLTEQIFAMQSGPWLLTLITVHSGRCGTGFGDTLRGFRAQG